MQRLHIKPLTRENFAEFGDVIDAPRGTGATVNEGSAQRFDRIAALENLRPNTATLNIAYFACAPRALPFAITTLEKHPRSAQLFVPMQVDNYLVLVSAPGDAPSELHAFLAHAGQGIAYRAGVWHHTLIALGAPARFACFVWEDGSADDCVVHPLPLEAQRILEQPAT
jgi:ureidoglycolate lyase